MFNEIFTISHRSDCIDFDTIHRLCVSIAKTRCRPQVKVSRAVQPNSRWQPNSVVLQLVHARSAWFRQHNFMYKFISFRKLHSRSPTNSSPTSNNFATFFFVAFVFVFEAIRWISAAGIRSFISDSRWIWIFLLFMLLSLHAFEIIIISYQSISRSSKW